MSCCNRETDELTKSLSEKENIQPILWYISEVKCFSLEWNDAKFQDGKWISILEHSIISLNI